MLPNTVLRRILMIITGFLLSNHWLTALNALSNHTLLPDSQWWSTTVNAANLSVLLVFLTIFWINWIWRHWN